MKRVSVIGSTGSGKTTFAKALAARLGVPYLELDSMYWQSDWREADLEEFRARVSEAVARDAWVIDGMYWSRIGGLVLTRADTACWLDPPFAHRFARLLWRTVRRSVTRVELWNGNRESLREAFFSRKSLLLFAIRTAPGTSRRQAYLAQFPHLVVHRFRSQRDADRWLASVQPPVESGRI